MPVVVKKNGRKEVDAAGVAKIFEYSPHIYCCVMEDVAAMTYTNAQGEKRGQGAAASFAFGKAAGVVIGVLAALEIKTHLVMPAVWKSLLNLSSDKNLSRSKARAIFSREADLFLRKKDNDRAEAALLAHFASQRFV